MASDAPNSKSDTSATGRSRSIDGSVVRDKLNGMSLTDVAKTHGITRALVSKILRSSSNAPATKKSRHFLASTRKQAAGNGDLADLQCSACEHIRNSSAQGRVAAVLYILRRRRARKIPVSSIAGVGGHPGM